MKKILVLGIAVSAVVGLSGCASTPEGSCKAYWSAVGTHLANTLEGQPDFGDFLRELNGVKNGAPEEMKALLQTDLEEMTATGSDTREAMPVETGKYCAEFLEE
jgi:hypothetical protein